MKTDLKQNSLFYKAQLNLDIIILPFAFFIILAALSVATSFRFVSFSNFSSIAFQLPELGLFALAMMLAMSTGGIDLSVISLANLSGVVMAWLLKSAPTDLPAGLSILLTAGVIIVGLTVAVFLGMINGILVGYVEVPPVLATLSTMIFYEGITLSITRGKALSGMPEMFTSIGNGSILMIPIPFIIFAVLAVIVRIMVKRSPFGKYQVMMGSNKKALEYAGINVVGTTIKTYMMCAFLAGVAAVIMTARLNTANARLGNSYMLLSVLISVLGGTNPDGGYVRVGGVIIALFTLQILNSGINFLGISQFIALTLWGVLLVLIIMYRRYAAEKRDRLLSDMKRLK